VWVGRRNNGFNQHLNLVSLSFDGSHQNLHKVLISLNRGIVLFRHVRFLFKERLAFSYLEKNTENRTSKKEFKKY
jgi:hypothetical protein